MVRTLGRCARLELVLRVHLLVLPYSVAYRVGAERTKFHKALLATVCELTCFLSMYPGFPDNLPVAVLCLVAMACVDRLQEHLFEPNESSEGNYDRFDALSA